MTRYVSVLLAGVALACAAITAPSVAATYDFHDEFSGTSLNTAVWTAETRNFDGVCAAASNVRLSGGYLRMTARRGGTSDCPWVGSRVVTKDKRYLGYGLVRSLVQQIGGEIDIRSETDVGLTVTISFPASHLEGISRIS